MSEMPKCIKCGGDCNGSLMIGPFCDSCTAHDATLATIAAAERENVELRGKLGKLGMELAEAMKRKGYYESSYNRGDSAETEEMQPVYFMRKYKAEVASLRKKLEEAEKEATETIRYLRCEKCEECYEAEEGNDYSSGVFCPECRKQGYMLVGVCHLHTEKRRITQEQWDALCKKLKEADASYDGVVSENDSAWTHILALVYAIMGWEEGRGIDEKDIEAAVVRAAELRTANEKINGYKPQNTAYCPACGGESDGKTVYHKQWCPSINRSF